MNELLKILAGEWIGAGAGEYPTITSFEYLETLRFALDETGEGLQYEQRTQRQVFGGNEYIPSHKEDGLLQLLADKQVKITNTQLGGREEVLVGTLEATPAGLVLQLQSTHFANDPRMEEASRTITVAGDTLHYTMYMQTNQVTHLALHLEATLQRRK